MREHAPVIAVQPAGDHVVVSLAEETLEAAAVIVTAGRMVARRAAAARDRARRQRHARDVAVLHASRSRTLPSLIDPLVPEPGRLPELMSFGLLAPGVASSRRSPVRATADPDEEGAPDPAIVDWTSDWVARRYRDVEPRPLSADTCFYTTTPDESFVLERHDRIVVGSATRVTASSSRP